MHYIMYGDIAVAAELLMIPERPFLQSLGQPNAALFSSNSHYEVGFGHKIICKFAIVSWIALLSLFYTRSDLLGFLSCKRATHMCTTVRENFQCSRIAYFWAGRTCAVSRTNDARQLISLVVKRWSGVGVSK